MTFRCEIVAEDGLVYEGSADMVILPGIDGEMGILPNHSPLLSLLDPGVVRVKLGDDERDFSIMGGVVEVTPEQVNVMATAAEDVEEIDISRAEAAKERALQRMAGEELDKDAYLRLKAALKRSNIRLTAAQRYRRGRRRIAAPDIQDENFNN